MSVEFIDNSEEVKSTMHDALIRALEKIGMTAEKYAKRLCPVDTGNLRNSITHRVDEGEPAAYIGSDTEYASYVCLGTGKYAEGGRPTPWVYQDAKGKFHWTAGNKAKPFLKPAVADHKEQYREIIKSELENA
ncbi:MAG: HK97 gp10 family phage protein [Clostridiales bacterium]|nr:HK97 gp10 family phage protein [Clostridiales bacterium]